MLLSSLKKRTAVAVGSCVVDILEARLKEMRDFLFAVEKLKPSSWLVSSGIDVNMPAGIDHVNLYLPS